MPSIRFTQNTLETCKPVMGKQVDYWDKKTAGFGLRVSPGGKKTWIYKYRTRNGSQRRYKIGDFDKINLAKAKDKLVILAGLVASGADPAQDKSQEKLAGTVKELAEQYIKTKKSEGKRSVSVDEAIILRDILPVIGTLNPNDVTRDHITKITGRLKQREKHTQANRVFEIVRGLFYWAFEERKLTSVVRPYYGKRPTKKERPRVRRVKLEEIRTIWGLLDKPAQQSNHVRLQALRDKENALRVALKLLLVLGQRSSEISQARKSEFDLEAKLWIIPGERAKNGEEHRVPLPDLAMSLVKEAWALSGESPFLFPSTRASRNGVAAGNNPVFKTSPGHALHRLLEGSDIEDIIVHDFRSIGASQLRGVGVNIDTIAAVLNHKPAKVTAKHYAFDSDQEKRRALETWETILENILAGRQGLEADNVTAIGRAVA